MANTLSTHTLRQKYFKSNLEVALRSALVAEDVCMVDRSDLKTIENPYITQQTAAVQASAGTYSVSAMTTTDDTLTVADEVIFGTHVYDFETLTSNFNLIANFMDDLTYSVAFKVDQFVLNSILDTAGSSYTTPSGGFETAGNVQEIFAELVGKVAGYQSGMAGGHFLVLENTDVSGVLQAQIGTGFSYSDAAANNGLVGSLMGVDIYVVRSGLFVDDTLGTLTVTNADHRLFGVKNVAMYATPRGVRYEEKGVSEKTGKEVVVSVNIGAKLWTPKANQCVDITLAA